MTAPASLGAEHRRTLLRFVACGSVDDGKSTLIGRLLHDTGAVADDQLSAVRAETRGEGAPDLSLLLDGLAAEREQGITIDVAYRFFSTARRSFIVADTPGHEQYTRNMATGASTADLAVILVDARKGLSTQTRRHSHIVALLGVREVILAVNKMDLVSWSEATFDRIAREYAAFAAQIGPFRVSAVPVSALSGDNLAARSQAAPWYQGPSLLELLESAEPPAPPADLPFRMPVQWVNRPNADFRGYAGLIVSGIIAPGDTVRALPSGVVSTVERIVTFDGDLDRAESGQSITLVLRDNIDVSRGDVLAAAAEPPEVAEQFEAAVVWMEKEPLLPGREYLMKLGARQVRASVTGLKHRIDVDTLQPLAARTLAMNDIGVCNLSLDRPVTFEPYELGRELGGFILIDPLTDATAGAGMIRFALRRSGNIRWQELSINQAARAGAKGQAPRVLWFTGLSGAGKSTLANLLEKRLHAEGRHTYLLDGDNVRHGLNRDLGFTDADRVENIRRLAEVAKLMADAGLIVLVSSISPFRAERRSARALFAPGEFLEVFVNAPLAVAEARDPKGLYRKARSGELKNFTGVDSPYEPPEAPEIVIDTSAMAPEAATDIILERLKAPHVGSARV